MIVRRPVGLDLMQTYFSTDFKTVLMCFISTIEGRNLPHCTWKYHYDSFSNSYVFEFGKSFLKLKRRDNYFEARIHAPCEDCNIVARRTKVELELIVMSGYPPWYQNSMKNEHGVAFTFPQLDNRSIARAGWIVAIGLGDASTLPYFATSFGDFEPLFTGSHHRGPGRGSYWRACRYLLEFISDQLEKVFPDDKRVRLTRQAVDRMLEKHTGSGISSLLDNTPLEGAMLKGRYTDGLNASDIDFAISIFNNLELGRPHIDRLKGIILPVLAAANKGLYNVLQHLNTHSFQLRRT